MPSAIEQAMRQICEEKGLAYESVLDAIQSALAAAYRKDFGDKNQNIEVEFDPSDGSVKAYDVKTVVEDIDLEELERMEQERREKAEELAKMIEEARGKGKDIPAVSFDEEEGPRYNPKTDMMISEAKKIKKNVELEDVLRISLEVPGEFGRMAAMTAKQVITQKLREAEREVIFNEFKEFEGQIINGTVQRREGKIVLVDLGRATGVIRPEDQIPSERYNPGERIKVFVRQVALSAKGAEILLSRVSEELVRKLFEFEIPEIADAVIDIKGIAREAGSRSKVSVHTQDEQIDPIGACIGQRGTRIQTIIGELGGEKIDIIEWDENPVTYIANSLSPAKIVSVQLNEADRSSTVQVQSDQLSLAIGKNGQNARLAARLTEWKINIIEVKEDGEKEEVLSESPDDEVSPEEVKSEADEEVVEDIEKKEPASEEVKDENTKSEEEAPDSEASPEEKSEE
ncbi:MAG: transcription termination factor NusA [Patescibacteria group bacterium]